MKSKYFLGVDIGTYESKGVLTDESARVVARAARAHEMESPKPGYAEHDAENTWWADFCALTKALLRDAAIDARDVEAVAVSAIGPCCLPVDEALRPLRKAILYGVDVRAAKEIDEINAIYGEDAIFERCGTPITSQSAAAKILWLRRNEPDVFSKARWFLTSSSYLTAKLTGRCAIDHYTAAAWAPLYDVAGADWESDTSLFCDRGKLADILWTDEIAGRVTEEAARETGLRVGTKVLVGTADAASEAVSVGVLDAGDMMIMYGSSIFIIHVTDRLAKDRRLWTGPYLFPGTWAMTGGMSCAGTLTRWFRDQLARDAAREAAERGENAYALLAQAARDIPVGSDGLIVLPYFSGERTPINDPLAQGVVFGLNLHHTREHVYRACLEGVGCGIAQHFDIFREIGVETKKVMAVGGGTKNALWLKAVSDICEKSQRTTEERIGAAYGDALLAALATGFIENRAALSDLVRVSDVISPDPSARAACDTLRRKYGALYRATKDIMHDRS